jgi:hypothetical protein
VWIVKYLLDRFRKNRSKSVKSVIEPHWRAKNAGGSGQSVTDPGVIGRIEIARKKEIVPDSVRIAQPLAGVERQPTAYRSGGIGITATKNELPRNRAIPCSFGKTKEAFSPAARRGLGVLRSWGGSLDARHHGVLQFRSAKRVKCHKSQGLFIALPSLYPIFRNRRLIRPENSCTILRKFFAQINVA